MFQVHTLSDNPILVSKNVSLVELKKIVAQKLSLKSVELYYLGQKLSNDTPLKSCLYVENPKANQLCLQVLHLYQSTNPIFHTIDFPPTLTTFQRKFIHALCDDLGLFHQSIGKDEYRFLRVSKKQLKKSVPKGVSEVIPNFLFLGSGADANDVQCLLQKGITCILNVTEEWPQPRELKGIMFKRIPLRDEEEEELLKKFEMIFDFLDDVKKRKKRVLIHCAVGKSRSAAIVIGYLMKSQRRTLQEAYHVVRRVRPIIAPNDGFITQLMEYEKKLFQVKQTSLKWTFGVNTRPKRKNPIKEKYSEEMKKKCKELAEKIVTEELLQEGVEQSVKEIRPQLLTKYLRHMQSIVRRKVSEMELKEIDSMLFTKCVNEIICKWYKSKIQ